MENTWSFESSNVAKIPRVRQNVTASAHQERDRRSRSVQTVSMFANKLMRMYPPMIAREYLSGLMRQRGVPSLDSFTSRLVGSFRAGLGHDRNVEGIIRKLMVLSRWSNGASMVTLWTTEPVVSTTLIHGNTLDVAAAKENFMGELNVIDPLTMTTHAPSVSSNRIMGRWAGWLVWRQMEAVGQGNPACMNCNLSGSTLFFAIHDGESRVIHMMLTPESMPLLTAYSRGVCRQMGTTSSVATGSSTKLKFQPGLAVGTATSLTLYGNGSMQLCGSPNDIEGVCRSMLATVRAVMDSEMVPFLETMRRADVSVI